MFVMIEINLIKFKMVFFAFRKSLLSKYLRRRRKRRKNTQTKTQF